MRNPSTRLAEFDGLRGVAAAIVAASHLIQAFAPWFVFGGATSALWINGLAASPLFVFYSGPFWVYIFFTLSGFVISGSAEHSSASLPLLALRRFLRLAVPVTCAAVVTWLLYASFPGAAKQATLLVGHPWIGNIGPETAPSFQASIRTSLEAFWRGYSDLNPALWTMRIELGGSIAVYAMYRYLPVRLRVALSIPAMLALLWTFDQPTTGGLECFLAGSLMYENEKSRLVPKGWWSWLLIALGLVVGGLPMSPCSQVVCETIFAASASASLPAAATHSLGAMLLFAGLCLNGACRSALARPAAQFLGRVSLPLYLIHMPFLGTVIAATYDSVGLGWFAFPLVVETALLLIACDLFNRYVDTPLVAGLRRLKLPDWALRKSVLQD
jgi:peptidoglycan/LPS O-acetylase OafA/YrhL